MVGERLEGELFERKCYQRRLAGALEGSKQVGDGINYRNMKVETLVPLPTNKRPFRRSHQKFIPNRSGCYVLSTFSNVILYVGLAIDLRRRIGEHLDNPKKTAETRIGRAIWFHFLEAEDLNRVERTWMNIHIQHEGCIPPLNRIYSPTFT